MNSSDISSIRTLPSGSLVPSGPSVEPNEGSSDDLSYNSSSENSSSNSSSERSSSNPSSVPSNHDNFDGSAPAPQPNSKGSSDISSVSNLD